MMKNNPNQNSELQHLRGYLLDIAQDKLSFAINNRKNGDLSRVHAYSPQVSGAKLHHGTALYFVSCDFKGSDMKYSDNKFEAVKAYLDVLGVDYRVVICNTLPRHNWKYYLRHKEIDFARYDEILKECKCDGKQAAEIFYQEAEKATSGTTPHPEQEIEQLCYKITQNANQKRVDQCRRIFSDAKIILWSDYYQNLSELIEKHHVALKGCYNAVTQGARNREGNLIDNIVYKQEELVVDLHIAESLQLKPVVAFYNEFSKQSDQTGHMKACEVFGHFQVLDILFEDEFNITQALLDAGSILKKEIKPNDHEKQLANCLRFLPTIQPSLQKEFLLDLLEQSKFQVPSQYKFIDSCLKLYKTLNPSLQLKFIEALLEHPKKRVAAYFEFLDAFDPVYQEEDIYYQKRLLTYEVRQTCIKAHSSSDPRELYGVYEKMRSLMQVAFDWRSNRYLGMSPVHMASQMPARSKISLENGSQHSSSMLDILIDAGATVQVKDKLGRTPLYHAICSRSVMNVKILIKAGVRIDERVTGYTELVELSFIKAMFSHVKEVKEIVSIVEDALLRQKSPRNK